MSTRREFLTGAGTAAVGQCATARQSRTVPTATGEISPDEMGVTSVHEHLAFRRGEPAEQRKRSMEFAVAELRRARQLGLRTIVDVGPSDDVEGIREAALETGVQVVCCTGFYVLTAEQQSMTFENFRGHMMREAEGGVQGTRIRPGVIKVASRRVPTGPAERAVLAAAAEVHRQARLPICIHSVSGCAEQQRILEEAGADLKHCYFSHVEATFGWEGRTLAAQTDYLENVVRKGSTLCFNNFGNWNHTKPEDLAHILRELSKRGYDDRMVATMDLTWSYNEGRLKILWEDTNEGGRDRTFSYLLERAVPWMRQNGIPKRSTDKYVKHNPERIFTWAEGGRV